MSFKLIKAAQAVSRIGHTDLQLAHRVSQILKTDVLSESFNAKDFEVTPEHYTQWLETIQSIANERNVKLSKRMDFNEIAFELLDNDSFVDSMASDESNLEQTKENIVKALWQSYKVNQAAARVKSGVDNTIQQVQDEERVVRSLAGAEDEESGFAQAMRTHMGVEDEQLLFKRSMRPGTVYQQAVGKQTAFNPYPEGSLRASIWADMNSSGTNQSGSSAGGAEDEESLASANDHHADVGGEEALEQQVADLAQRVADLEAHEEGEHELDFTDEVDPESAAVLGADAMDSDPISQPEPSLKFTSKQPQLEDEEQVQQIFQRAITSPRNLMTSALKKVEDEGGSAWKGVSMPRNPHPKDTPAFKAWAKGMKNAAIETFGLTLKAPAPTVKPKSHKK